MRTDLPAQAGDLLRQDNAEFGNQPTQAVIERRAFLDKALPCAVQAQDDLLVLFLDRDKAHLGPGDGLSDGGSVRCVVFATLAGHAVRSHKFRRDQFDAVAVLSEQPRPVVGAGAGFHADQTRREMGDQRQ